jgi:sRNA-binding protein
MAATPAAQAATAAGGLRIDLNGKAAGEVTPAEAAWAREKLARSDAAAKAPQQAPLSAPTCDKTPQALAKKPPGEQRRDGLNALRQAAAARRQDPRKTSMGPAVEEMSQGPKARDIFDKGPMLPLGGTHGGQENTRAS